MILRTENLGDNVLIEQKTWSTGFVKAIFPMEDVFLSYLDVKEERSLLFVKHIREKKKNEITTTFFWWEEGVSWSRGKFYPLPAGAVDTLASIYVLRASLDRLPRKLTVHDRGKSYEILVSRAVPEKISIAGREVRALRVEPRAIDPSRDRDADMTIWFSTSEAHVPLKMKFSAALGSLTATLDPYCE